MVQTAALHQHAWWSHSTTVESIMLCPLTHTALEACSLSQTTIACAVVAGLRCCAHQHTAAYRRQQNALWSHSIAVGSVVLFPCTHRATTACTLPQTRTWVVVGQQCCTVFVALHTCAHYLAGMSSFYTAAATSCISANRVVRSCLPIPVCEGVLN